MESPIPTLRDIRSSCAIGWEFVLSIILLSTCEHHIVWFICMITIDLFLIVYIFFNPSLSVANLIWFISACISLILLSPVSYSRAHICVLLETDMTILKKHGCRTEMSSIETLALSCWYLLVPLEVRHWNPETFKNNFRWSSSKLWTDAVHLNGSGMRDIHLKFVLKYWLFLVGRIKFKDPQFDDGFVFKAVVLSGAK